MTVSAESRYGIRTLVTGFGPFGNVVDNPSMRLALESGRTCQILEVAYAAVDQFLNELAPESFDLLIMLGVAGQAQKIRQETVGRNRIGSTPDVRGVVLGPGAIDPNEGPQIALPSTVLPPTSLHWELSTDAGDYLCNYLFFRALQRFNGKRVRFVHVPPFDVIPKEVQQSELHAFLKQQESSGLLP